jgi:hypothetical protein
VTIGIVALVIVVVLISSGGSNRRTGFTMPKAKKQYVPRKPRVKKVKRYDELGGLSLGEHMKKTGAHKRGAAGARNKRRSKYLSGN